MYSFITILIILVSVLLGAVVLIQKPKGGGLSSSFGSIGQQILGARRSTDIIEKITWSFAVLLLVFTLSLSLFIDQKVVQKQSSSPAMTDFEKKLVTPVRPTAPVAPTTTPPAQTLPVQSAPSGGN